MSTDAIGNLLQMFLLADETIAALIVNMSEADPKDRIRIYPVLLPQKPKMPAIVYTRISGERIGNLRGPASAAEPRYQIDAWASNFPAALALGKAIRQRLEAYVGTWGDSASPAVSVFVQVRFETERDLFEEDINGGLCRHSADYFIFHGTNSGVL